MSPNKRALCEIGASFVIMLGLCSWVMLDRLNGPGVGAGAICLIWIWVAMKIGKHADAENDRLREQAIKAKESALGPSDLEMIYPARCADGSICSHAKPAVQGSRAV